MPAFTHVLARRHPRVAVFAALAFFVLAVGFHRSEVHAAPTCPSTPFNGIVDVVVITSATACDFIAPTGSTISEVIVIAGGGGGGAGGAGGGGGEVRTSSDVAIRGAGTLEVLVGAGGIGGSFGVRAPSPGGDSVVSIAGVEAVRAKGGLGGAGTGGGDFSGAGGGGGSGGVGNVGGRGGRNPSNTSPGTAGLVGADGPSVSIGGVVSRFSGGGGGGVCVVDANGPTVNGMAGGLGGGGVGASFVSGAWSVSGVDGSPNSGSGGGGGNPCEGTGPNAGLRADGGSGANGAVIVVLSTPGTTTTTTTTSSTTTTSTTSTTSTTTTTVVPLVVSPTTSPRSNRTTTIAPATTSTTTTSSSTTTTTSVPDSPSGEAVPPPDTISNTTSTGAPVVVEANIDPMSDATRDVLDVFGSTFGLQLQLDMTVGEPVTGSRLTSSVSGLAPGSEAVLEIRSEPRELDRRLVDGAGNVSFVTKFPDGIEPGLHRLILGGTSPDGRKLFATAAVEVGANGEVVAFVGSSGSVGSPASISEMSRAVEAGVPLYDVDANLGTVVALGVALGLMVTVTGGSRKEEDEPSLDESNRDESAKGDIGGVETKALTFEGFDAVALGDASRLWRILGDERWRTILDAVASRCSRWSAVLPRIVDDGHWLRAMFGGLDPMLVLVGLVIGVVSATDVDGGLAVPGFAFIASIVVLSVLDALIGLAAFVGFVVTFVVMGGPPDFFEFRTLLGLLVLFVSTALLANSIRPIRRKRAEDREGAFDRVADYLMMPIFVAFGMSGLYSALNGLSGLHLVSSSDTETLRNLILASVIVRMLAEDAAVRWFPARLARTAPRVREPVMRWMSFVNVGSKGAIFLLGAGTFFGFGTMTWVVIALMSLVPLLKIWSGSFPNFDRVHKWFPRGLLRAAIMTFLGAWFARYVVAEIADPENFRATAALVLIPGIFIGLVDLVARKGGSWPDGWWKRLGGGAAWAITFAALLGWIVP